ncbi:NUDIX domain-containing protein [Streptomyces sp. NPDC008125]|uniref:NUDIX domain-containing protein n=1 Tax=Streptomyces sp. NPDC008125 TaxID=3364811 RepID=UPI0036E33A4C
MAETKTARVERTIREWMGNGRLAPGDKMPSERVLAEELEIGRTALRQVLARLVAEGVLEVRNRSSYRVPAPEGDGVHAGAATPGGLEPWLIHGSRPVYNNQWVRLELVDVEPPSVPRFEHHVVRLQHVAVTAVLDNRERVLMLWRYRFVPDQWGWELPGGIVDAGENASTCARREVEEETGWRPANLEHIVTYQPMVGMVDSPHEIFVGTDAERIGDPTDVEEAGRVEWVPLADIPELMARGQLMGSGTLVALLHVLATRQGAATASA